MLAPYVHAPRLPLAALGDVVSTKMRTLIHVAESIGVFEART